MLSETRREKNPKFSLRNFSDLAPSSAHDELGGCTMHLIRNRFVTIRLSHIAISCHQEMITIISPERSLAQSQACIIFFPSLHFRYHFIMSISHFSFITNI